jgi:hypothetical protein
MNEKPILFKFFLLIMIKLYLFKQVKRFLLLKYFDDQTIHYNIDIIYIERENINTNIETYI